VLLVLLFVGVGRSQKGDTIHCASCGQLLAHTDEICRIMGRPPSKTYLNPHGVVCPILTLGDAEGLAHDDHSSSEHTWFAGYAWRPVACDRCGLFLGWRFEATSGARPESFYGLLEERLVTRESPDQPTDAN